MDRGTCDERLSSGASAGLHLVGNFAVGENDLRANQDRIVARNREASSDGHHCIPILVVRMVSEEMAHYGQVRLILETAICSLPPDNDLLRMLRDFTAWEPEQYGYLQQPDRASVLSMLRVMDVASPLGRMLGPTQVLREADFVERALAAHRIAGTVLERQMACWD